MPREVNGKKICSRCRRQLTVDLFGGNKTTTDGYNWWCRYCQNEKKRARTPKLYELDKLKEQGLRRCYKCLVIKPLDAFYRSALTSDRFEVQCKDCRTKAKKEWVNKNPDRIKLYQRRNDFRRKYGIKIEQYDEMFSFQNGKCAICLTEKPGGDRIKHFSIDHDHTCCPERVECGGRCIRGLLCARCNTLIGRAEDNVSLFKQAIEYLENYSAIKKS